MAVKYVDIDSIGGTSSDTNLGTITSPWKTIKHAMQTAVAGDTVYVRTGTYYESLNKFTNEGTAELPIVFQPYNHEEVIINPGLMFNDWQPYELYGNVWSKTFPIDNETVEHISFGDTWGETEVGSIKRAGIENDPNSGYGVTQYAKYTIDGYVEIGDLTSFLNFIETNEIVGGLEQMDYDYLYVDADTRTAYIKLANGNPNTDIYMIDNARRISVERPYNEIHGFIVQYGLEGIKVQGHDAVENANIRPNNVTICNNTFRYSYGQGILVTGSDANEVIVDNNTVSYCGRPFKYYNEAWQINNLDHGIYFAGGSDCIISNNNLSKSMGQNLHPWCSYGTSFYNHNINLKIYNNYVEGGFVATGTNIRVYNNLFLNSVLPQYADNYTFTLYPVDGCEIYNNLILGTNCIFLGHSPTGGEVTKGVKLKNNIIQSNSGDVVFVQNVGTDLDDCEFDYNLYYGGVFKDSTGTIGSLTDWQNYLVGQYVESEINSLETDPLLDVNNKITYTSPAKGLGTPIDYINSDMYNTPRGALQYAGPYIYEISLCKIFPYGIFKSNSVLASEGDWYTWDNTTINTEFVQNPDDLSEIVLKLTHQNTNFSAIGLNVPNGTFVPGQRYRLSVKFKTTLRTIGQMVLQHLPEDHEFGVSLTGNNEWKTLNRIVDIPIDWNTLVYTENDDWRIHLYSPAGETIGDDPIYFGEVSATQILPFDNQIGVVSDANTITLNFGDEDTSGTNTDGIIYGQLGIWSELNSGFSNKLAEGDITYRKIFSSPTSKQIGWFKIPLTKFSVDENGLPTTAMVIEIGYKDTMTDSDIRHYPSSVVPNYAVFKTKIDYYAMQDDMVTLDPIMSASVQNNDKQYMKICPIGGNNTEQWTYIQIPFRKNQFQLLRALTDNGDECFLFGIETNNGADNTDFLINYITMRSITDEACEDIFATKRNYDGFYNIESVLPPDEPENNIIYDSNIAQVFIRDNEKPIYETTKPSQEECLYALSFKTIPDEIEPFSFGIYSELGVENLTVDISDFVHINGTYSIPISDGYIEYVDIFEVVYDLSRVNSFVTSGNLGNESKYYQNNPDRLEAFSTLSINANTSKRVWMRLHVPSNQYRGIYNAAISIKQNGNEISTINVSVEILPLTISSPDDIFHTLYSDPYTRVFNRTTSSVFEFYRNIGINPIVNCNPACIDSIEDTTAFEIYFNKMYDEGCFKQKLIMLDIHSSCYNLYDALFNNQQRWNDAGNTIGYGGFVPNYDFQWYCLWDNLSSQTYHNALGQILNKYQEIAAAKGHEFVFSIKDEPGSRFYPRIICYQIYSISHEYGWKNTITYYSECDSDLSYDQTIYIHSLPVDPYLGDYIPSLTNLVDYKVWSPSPSHVEVGFERHQAEQYGNFAYYTTYFSNLRLPLYNRFFHGLEAYATGAKQISCYALGDIINDPFNDFDRYTSYTGITYAMADFILAYPTWNGTFIPTMASEGIREGIKDLNYLYTLENNIELQPSLLISIEAKAWLDSIKNLADASWTTLANNTGDYYTAVPKILNVVSQSSQSDEYLDSFNDFEAFSRIRETAVEYINEIQNSLPTLSDFQSLESLPKYHYSWPPNNASVYSNEMMKEYIRISHSSCISLWWWDNTVLNTIIDNTVNYCKQIKEENPDDLEPVIGLNFGSFFILWDAYYRVTGTRLEPGDRTTLLSQSEIDNANGRGYNTVVIQSDLLGLTIFDAELKYWELKLRTAMQYVAAANLKYSCDIKIKAFIDDSETFNSYPNFNVNIESTFNHDIADALNEFQMRITWVWEDENQKLYDPTGNAILFKNNPLLWQKPYNLDYYTYETVSWRVNRSGDGIDFHPYLNNNVTHKIIPGPLNVPLYTPTHPAAIAAAVEANNTLANTLGQSEVIPWIALGCGYKSLSDGVEEYVFDDDWSDYNPYLSYEMGYQSNGGSILYAKADAIILYESPLYTTAWNKHFVAYVQGANNSSKGQVTVTNSLTRYLKNDTTITGTSSANIKLGKNETRAFQFVIINPNTDLPIDTVHIECSGISGQIIPELIFYREHYVNITEESYAQQSSRKDPSCPTGWYPDALIPFANPYTQQVITSATYLAQDFTIEPQTNQAYWVDIKVGSDVIPGIYTTEIVITYGEYSEEIQRIPVTIEVLNYIIPETTRYKKWFGSIRTDNRTRFSSLNDGQGPTNGEWANITSNYEELLADHEMPTFTYIRANSTGSTASDTFNATEDVPFSYAIAAETAFSHNKSDICYFLIRWGGSTAIENESRVTWGLEEWTQEQFDLDAANRIKYLTACEELYNMRSPYDASWIKNPVFYFDEPNNIVSYNGLIAYAADIHTYAPSFKLLVTEQPDNELYHMIDYPSLIGTVDIWCPLFSYIWTPSGKENIQNRIADGEEAWSYTALIQGTPYSTDEEFLSHPEFLTSGGLSKLGYCNWHTEAPLVHYLAPAWINYNLGITGILEWTQTHYDDGIDPWVDSQTYINDGGLIYNGEGMTFYPGVEAGVPEGFVPSIRAKILRESHIDYKLFELLEEKIGVEPSKEIINDLVNINNYFDFSQTIEDYSSARTNIQNLIIETPSSSSSSSSNYADNRRNIEANDSRIIFSESALITKYRLDPTIRSSTIIVINNVEFIVCEVNSSLVWDLSGQDEYNFTIAGEYIYRTIEQKVYKITYEGIGSYLFNIELFSTTTSINDGNYIVVYRLDDEQSKEFAEYYASVHHFDTSSLGNPQDDYGTWQVDGQLVGIACSNTEILSNETDFNTQVLYPLQEALTAISDQRIVMAIVLGFNVPGGFYDGTDIISATSRLSVGCASVTTDRTEYKPYIKKTFNPLYNRAIYTKFNYIDSLTSLIVSRIDAPSLNQAKEMVNNAYLVTTKRFVDGTFYFDKYSDQYGTDADNYNNILNDFEENILSSLNLTIWSTVQTEPYIDSVIPFVQNDSFVWSWLTDRADPSFFQMSSNGRVFFYNADFDGAQSLRDETLKTWPILSTYGGYATTASSMSNPGIDGFLNPSAFFNALINKATIGEAYLYSMPYLDWTTTLIGDPLVSISFPDMYTVVNQETSLSVDESWNRMVIELSKAASYLYKKANSAYAIRGLIIDSANLDMKLSLLPLSQKMFIVNNEASALSQLKQLVGRLFDYITRIYMFSGLEMKYPTINDYLTEKNIKISQLISNISGSAIEDTNLLEEGWWNFDFNLNNDANKFVNYHFILNVYSDSNYQNLELTLNSQTNVVGWYYENRVEEFAQIPYDGVPSSFIGRRIRYISIKTNFVNQYLERGNIYYFTITQHNASTGEIYQQRDYSNIIYT